jgi:hypothetical protein
VGCLVIALWIMQAKSNNNERREELFHSFGKWNFTSRLPR